MEYRFDNAYGAIHDADTGRYICSYIAAGISRKDTRAAAIKKMEQREELLALEDPYIDETWIDQGELS